MRFRRKESVEKLNNICEALKEKPMTLLEIEDKLGFKRNALQKYLFELRRTNRVHIASYNAKNKDNGKSSKHSNAALFKLGKGISAPRKTYVSKNDYSDVKVFIVTATAMPFPKNTDPLMHALYGMI